MAERKWKNIRLTRHEISEFERGVKDAKGGIGAYYYNREYYLGHLYGRRGLFASSDIRSSQLNRLWSLVDAFKAKQKTA